MNYLEALRSRYAVKKFDSQRKITNDQLDRILEATRLSASSLGLQPYRLLVVQNPEKLQELIPAFINPSQVSTCSHLVVFITQNFVSDEYLDSYITTIAEQRNQEVETLVNFRTAIAGFRNSKNPAEVKAWNGEQTYLALGTALMAAALEGVDSCPMEGFHADRISQMLNINPETEYPAVILALGHRAEDDALQNMTKIRKPQEDFVQIL